MPYLPTEYLLSFSPVPAFETLLCIALGLEVCKQFPQAPLPMVLGGRGGRASERINTSLPAVSNSSAAAAAVAARVGDLEFLPNHPTQLSIEPSRYHGERQTQFFTQRFKIGITPVEGS